ncbi:NAD-dependent epimerase/dehydratase family protein [Streptomyces inhibens]|uniref:NAD-dependent epimerase/dehydratase family protein n=1 Tax=Streptomyces inhibens TaxID=2293571 RepID=A0A371PXL6_STRIH|nr:SDR family oxidoreductase [Streptomyces inhibens]REK87226.1 NAD-dependent epimerase/dehydratase family protein [Streptomyces inhibens]
MSVTVIALSSRNPAARTVDSHGGLSHARFVTGASGWIGSAVVHELIGAGHQVVGLARSDASAAALASAGAEVVRGTLDDLDTQRSAAAASDSVIHLAFKHDIALSGDFQGATDADRRAVEAIGEALASSGRPFVIASGTPAEPGRVATEGDGHSLAPAAAAGGDGQQARAATSEWVLSLASHGVRSSVVRLPRTVHGEGDHGFIAALVRIARDKGVSGYFGDGTNRWPAVHRLDSAHLFRLALEKAPAGSTLHAVADEGVPLRGVAEVIGRHLNLPVVSISPADADEHFTWLAGILGADQPASSTLTRELMGWEPTQPGLIDDLDKGHYFRSPSA